MDPRAVAARMAERLASIGYSWEQIGAVKPDEMFLLFGPSAIDFTQGQLDLLDLIEQLGRELCDENGELKKDYVPRTGEVSASHWVLGEADRRRRG